MVAEYVTCVSSSFYELSVLLLQSSTLSYSSLFSINPLLPVFPLSLLLPTDFTFSHTAIMLLSTTTLLFATSSLAFLIPGDFNTQDLPKAEFLPVSYETNSQTLSLDCSTCPFALQSQRDGTHEWTNDVESELEMNFDTDGKAISFNGVPIYPTNSVLPPLLYVSQSKKDGQSSNMEGYDGNLRLSYSMEFDEKKFEDKSLVTMVMTIMGLDGQMVHVDNLKITVVKQEDGTVGTSLIYPSPKPIINIRSSSSTPSSPFPSIQTLQTPNVRPPCAVSLPRSSREWPRPKHPPRAPATR